MSSSVQIYSDAVSRAVLYALSEYQEFPDTSPGKIDALKALLCLTDLAHTVSVSVQDIGILLQFEECEKILVQGRKV